MEEHMNKEEKLIKEEDREEPLINILMAWCDRRRREGRRKSYKMFLI